jgi:hypothetical protein
VRAGATNKPLASALPSNGTFIFFNKGLLFPRSTILKIEPIDYIMNGVENKKKPGSGAFNANRPFGNNPYIQIPPDVDRNPFRLIWVDIESVFQLIKLLPLIIIPLRPCISGSLDELSRTWPNIRDLLLQTILVISQLLLIVSLPLMAIFYWFAPGIVHLAFGVAFAISTLFIMRLLNGGRRAECLVGLPDGQPPVNDEQELWFFINGICTGYVVLDSLEQ